jgi:4-amino-4-deoxy-L-arabinose transferase-like glycosyltransferase
MGPATLETPAETHPVAAPPSPALFVRFTDAKAVLVLAAVWVLMSAAAGPVGDFPLNDDWSFGRSVCRLVEDGRFELTGWMSMTFVVQLFWGALFCVPAGFSFTALRLSTLAAGLAGIVATYGLLRDANLRRRPAMLGGLVLAANPLYFHLSHTFMTDVPFVALATPAAVFFARSLRRERNSDLILGTLAACGATLVRQLGVAIPIGFAMATLVANPRRLKDTLRAVWPTMVVGGVLVGYNVGLARWHGVPALYHLPATNLRQMLVANGVMTLGVIAANAIVALFYVGLFTLPFTLARLSQPTILPAGTRARGPKIAAFGVFFGLLAACGFGFAGLPLVGNVLHDGGLGPLTLRDTYLLGLTHWPAVPFLHAGVAMLGALGAAVLTYALLTGLSALLSTTREDREPRARVAWFALAVSLAFFGPTALAGFYDRYLLLLLPLTMLALASLPRPIGSAAESGGRLLRTACVATILVVYAGFSVAATHDYIEWNRARWAATRWLVDERGVSPSRIDGGAEVNGWYLYRPEYQAQPEKSWWWVEDDEYLLAFGPVDGYAEQKAVGFTRWLPPGKHRVVVLRRSP